MREDEQKGEGEYGHHTSIRYWGVTPMHIAVVENEATLSEEDQAAIDAFARLVADVARRHYHEVQASLTLQPDVVYSQATDRVTGE